jgi:hypothetical protein
MLAGMHQNFLNTISTGNDSAQNGSFYELGASTDYCEDFHWGSNSKSQVKLVILYF